MHQHHTGGPSVKIVDVLVVVDGIDLSVARGREFVSDGAVGACDIEQAVTLVSMKLEMFGGVLSR